MQQVESEVFESYDYDGNAGILTLKFKSGKVRDYYGIKGELFKDFLVSESKGRFYNDWIKGYFASKETTLALEDLPPSDDEKDDDGKGKGKGDDIGGFDTGAS